MTSWVRRAFTNVGLTQYPPGPRLGSLQRKFVGGSVILCIDCSGSMAGYPLEQAVHGAGRFIDEAIEARYDVGLMLWSNRVDVHVPLSPTGTAASGALSAAKIYGGTDVMPALWQCRRDLAGLTGDRVVAIFSDGEVSRLSDVLETVAEMKADNVRFVTRGMGHGASWLESISSDGTSDVMVHSVETLAEDIAAMSDSLRMGRSRPL